MSKVYTLAVTDHGNGQRYEALYVDGRLLQAAEDERFSASTLLDLIAMDNIAVSSAFCDVDLEYDENVIAERGWPQALADVRVRHDRV